MGHGVERCQQSYHFSTVDECANIGMQVRTGLSPMLPSNSQQRCRPSVERHLCIPGPIRANLVAALATIPAPGLFPRHLAPCGAGMKQPRHGRVNSTCACGCL